MKLANFLQKRSYLTWYIADKKNISPEVAVEVVLNYGDFSDIKNLAKIISWQEMAEIFRRKAFQKRSNYKPEIKHYFDLYFKKYA